MSGKVQKGQKSSAPFVVCPGIKEKVEKNVEEQLIFPRRIFCCHESAKDCPLI
jgi:hypothetical protein